MSPFWYLAVGMGTAWLIASGRAGAVWAVLMAPPNNTPVQSLPPSGINTPNTCNPGWHWDNQLLVCVPDGPTG